MALRKLERRNYGRKWPVSIKYQNLHSFKEGLILLCQNILETRRITHLHGCDHFKISLMSQVPCFKADDKRYPKIFSRWSLALFPKSFIKYSNSGYAGSPKMHISTSGWPLTAIFLHWRIVPLRRLSKRFEVENTLASCAIPGHLINTSIKQ